MKISVAIITRNEELNLPDCLESVKWADEIVLVDSGSTDRTLEIAKRYTSNISHHDFKDFASQKNHVLSLCSGDWIFLIDADERVTEELHDELRKKAEANYSCVYAVRRSTYFFGKPLYFSGTQNDRPIRFFPKGKIHYEQPVHEHIVTELPVRDLESTLLHYTTRDMQQYQEKFDCYIPLEVKTMKEKGRRASLFDIYGRPAAKFVLLYFVKLGFLDGWTGFQFASLAAQYDAAKYRLLKKVS